MPLPSPPARRSIRIGGQSTALLRAALAWAARGSMGDGGSGKGKTGAAGAAASMYGDFRAAKEGAEEVRMLCYYQASERSVRRTRREGGVLALRAPCD